jgi:arylsulfatase A-like enzyme
MPPFLKKRTWILAVIVMAGIGLTLMGQFLNRSAHLGSGVTYGGDALDLIGTSWNREEIRQVTDMGRSAFPVPKHLPRMVRLDETADITLLVPGTIGEIGGIKVDISEGSREYPVDGAPWGEKGPCLVWRFRGVDMDRNWDCGGIEVQVNDRRSEEHTFHMSFLSRTATVPLVPGKSMKYIIVPDMTMRPNSTRVLEKRDSLDFAFPDSEGTGEIDIISVTLLDKAAAYKDLPAGNAYETLNQEIRPVVYQWTDGELAWDVHVNGTNPVLKFGSGLLPHTQPVSFSVTVDSKGKKKEIFSERVLTGDVWADHVVDLAEWRERTVRLIFKVRSLSSGVALWSSPRIVESGRRGKFFCIYLVDALRPDFCEGFSAFRGQENSTPAIRRLSERGVHFKSALANAPITKYSMASLFTGLYPSHSGIMQYQRIGDDIQTVAEMFRQNGFMTASFLLNNNAGRLRGLHQGFDVTFSTGRLSREARSLSDKDSLAVYGENPTLTSGGVINDFLFNFIRAHQEEDMLLYLHLMDTHAPYFPDEEYLSEFYRSMSQKGLAVPTDPARLLNELAYTQRPSYSPNDHLAEEALLDLYRGAARTADKHFQRFMDFLQSEGMDRDATLVFTADHGEHLNEHPDVRLFTHMHPLLLEVLRIPLIIDSPALVPGGKTVEEAVQLADVMPTLLDLAGIAYDPSHYDGVSLLGIVAEHGHPFFQNRPIVSQTSPSFWSVLRGDTHSPDINGGYDVMVYDIEEDPREHRPLSGDYGRKRLEALVDSLSIIAKREVLGTDTIINDGETLEQLKELGYIQ